MLKNSEPAGFTAFFYPGTEHIVRMHRHTDTDELFRNFAKALEKNRR